MQVTHEDAFVTHAVIGNQESVAMGVSDDAALMHILSSTLYTYRELAVVREILCNAWDAHIAAGKTDVPIQVTVADGRMTVRDFGFGIAHKDIGPIYGVYGSSTKRNDGTVTGGFGLGSKAPFAYVDTFEVVSHHLGQKTVYRMAKSSLEIGGKPSIHKIVSLPTDETGIAVSFAIGEKDHAQFIQLVGQVAYQGEILCSLNGSEPLAQLPLSTSPHGYLVTDHRTPLTQAINVRYGNAVYPVPEHEAYAREYHKTVRLLNQLWEGANLIFLAPANSLTIAPSREALILTDQTVATLSEQFSRLGDLGTLEQRVQIHLQQERRARFKKHLRELSDDRFMACVRNFSVLERELRGVRSPSTYQACSLHQALFKHFDRLQVDLPEHVWQSLMYREMLRRKTGQFHLVKSLFKAISSEDPVMKNRTQKGVQNWASRYLDCPLQQARQQDPVLAACRTSVRAGSGMSVYASGTSFRRVAASMTLRTYSCLALPEVLIARTKKEAEDFLMGGSGHPFAARLLILVGSVATATKRIQAAQAFAARMGWACTLHFPERQTTAEIPQPPAAPRKRSTGFPSLASSYSPRHNAYLLSHARAHCQPDQRVQEPVAWTVLRNRSYVTCTVERLSEAASHFVRQQWGDRIAVVTQTQVAKLKAAGIPSVTELLSAYVDTQLAESRDFRRYLAFAACYRNYRSDPVEELVSRMAYHPQLMESLGLRFGIGLETARLLGFFKELNLPRCRELACRVKPHPLFAKTVARINSFPGLRYIRVDSLSLALTGQPTNPEHFEGIYPLVRHLYQQGASHE